MSTPHPIEQFGRYNLLHRIAVGGMAEIFVACDPDAALADQLLVVKRIREEISRDLNFVKMFLDEARVFQRLSHPNIVRMLDFGEEAGRYYLALEYVWGESLAVLLHLCELGRTQFPVGAALYIGAETAKALQHAHALRGPDGAPSPVIHRDVTLGNVVISFHGEVKLLDFGIAKAKERLSRTEAGNVKGTLVYLAPEQVFQEEVGPYTDIYQLGVLLYKMLVGREPVESQSEGGIVTAIARGQIVAPSKALPGFPPQVERIILKAMAFKPSQRYRSAEALRLDITALLGAHLDLGKQRLASLIAYITGDRFQKQMSYINDLMQGARAEQEQSDLLRWVATANEPRKVSVELSDVQEIRAFVEQSTVTAEVKPPSFTPPIAPEIKVAPGPFLTIDPRVQAALAQAFNQPRDEQGGETDAGGGFPRDRTDIDLSLDQEHQTEVADMVFPDVHALLGEDLPPTVQRRAIDTIPTLESSAFEVDQTVETPLVPWASEEAAEDQTTVPTVPSVPQPRPTPLVDGFPTEGPTKPMDEGMDEGTAPFDDKTDRLLEVGSAEPPTLRLPKTEIPED